MPQLLGIVDYIAIAIMLAISTLIGLYFRFTGGRQKTTNEFLMGNQNVPITPVAISIIATSLSSVSVLGVPAEMYLHGTQYVITGLGIPLGGLLAAYGFLPVFYEMKVTTAYEYLERRFGRTTRTVVATLYTLLTVLDMGVVLYAPALALNAVTGLSTWASILTLAAVCMIYSSQGGLKAVVWTVVFQSALMYLAMIAVIWKVSMMLGFTGVFDIAREGGRFIFFEFSSDLTKRYTFWNAFAYGFTFWLLLYGTNQSTIQKFLSVGSLKKAQKALVLSSPFMMFFSVFTLWDGIALYALFHDCDPIEDESVKLRSADQLMPYGILHIFGNIPGLTGLCIAGVFSASLGALSSAINVLSNITVEDFIKPFCCCKNISDTWMAFIAKLLAVGYTCLILLMALIASTFGSILEAATIVYCMITAPILGIYILGMFSTTANEPGTLIGLMTGVALYAWAGFGNYITKPAVKTLPLSTAGCHANSSTQLLNASTEGTINESVTEMFSLTRDEETDVFIVYEISYMWLPLFAVAITIVVGYLSSCLLNLCFHVSEVRPETISPFVRKFYFKSSMVPDEFKIKTAVNEEQSAKYQRYATNCLSTRT